MAGDSGDAMVLRTLPRALDVLAAWDTGEAGDPEVFDDALDRVLVEAIRSDDPLRALCEVLFGLGSLSGLLLTELARATGRSRGELVESLRGRYVAAAVDA